MQKHRQRRCGGIHRLGSAHDEGASVRAAGPSVCPCQRNAVSARPLFGLDAEDMKIVEDELLNWLLTN